MVQNIRIGQEYPLPCIKEYGEAREDCIVKTRIDFYRALKITPLSTTPYPILLYRYSDISSRPKKSPFILSKSIQLLNFSFHHPTSPSGQILKFAFLTLFT
jgi:hypothetical protein